MIPFESALTGALGYIGSAINHILTREAFAIVGVDVGLFRGLLEKE